MDSQDYEGWLDNSQGGFFASQLDGAPEHVIGNKDVILEACKQDFYSLQHASMSIRGNKECVLEVCKERPAALQFASEWLREDKDLVLAVCQLDGLALEYASPTLRDDRDVVLVACTNKGIALKFASDRLRKDKDVALVACAEFGLALQHADGQLRADKDVVIAAAKSHPDSLKYALGGLNQDPRCLVAAGVWDDHDSKIDTTSNSNAVAPRKIVLSTRFSLAEGSQSKATQFAVLLKKNGFIQNGKFSVYSPNAFEKSTCDEEWTRFEWDCRGTYESCHMEPPLKSGIPQTGSCWRYSYRYQLEKAKRSNGFMIQLVEVGTTKGGDSISHGIPQTLGQGQRIEEDMAQMVGTKIFKVHAPILFRNEKHEQETEFNDEDIQKVVYEIRKWYGESCKDMSECTMRFYRDTQVKTARQHVDTQDIPKTAIGRCLRSTTTKQKVFQSTTGKEYLPEGEDPSMFDVLTNQGGRATHHPGNLVLKTKIDEYRPSFEECTDHKRKRQIVKSILDYIESRGGRFLGFDKQEKRYFIMPSKIAFGRVSSRLRYAVKLAKENLSGDMARPIAT